MAFYKIVSNIYSSASTSRVIGTRCDVLVTQMSSAKRHVYWDLLLQLRTWKSKITSRWLRRSPGSNHSRCRGADE